MDLNRALLDELLGAYALDAMEEEDRADVERRLDADPDLSASARQLQEVAAWLGAGEAVTPPDHLRQAVLGAATAVRRPGRSEVETVRPVDALRLQVDTLAALLDELTAEEWAAPTVTGWTVHELVGHLLGVEGYMARLVGLAPADDGPRPTGPDAHIADTLPTIAGERGQHPADTAARWRALAVAVVEHIEAGGDELLVKRVSLYGTDTSVRSAVLSRVFELWTHTDDVRRATGRPIGAPPPSSLQLMSQLAVRALPLGLAMVGRPRPGRTAKVVLTGRGGGTFTQPLGFGEQAGTPDVVLVANVVDFCRLAARRLAPDELAHDAEGDRSLADDVLVGAQVFAA